MRRNVIRESKELKRPRRASSRLPHLFGRGGERPRADRAGDQRADAHPRTGACHWQRLPQNVGHDRAPSRCRHRGQARSHWRTQVRSTQPRFADLPSPAAPLAGLGRTVAGKAHRANPLPPRDAERRSALGCRARPHLPEPGDGHDYAVRVARPWGRQRSLRGQPLGA